MAYNNPVMQLLGSARPVIPTSGLAIGANKMWDNSMNAFQKVADDLDSVKRNRAINELLSNVDMTDPYTGMGDALSGLMGIRGVDTKDAITLATGIAEPIIEQRKQDALEDYRNKSLGIQYLNATKRTPKGYGMVTDEYGTTYVFDKDTGSYKAIKGDTSGTIPPKYIGYTTVETEDPATGIKTKKQVAFDKRNPSVSVGGEPIVSTDYPTITKDDKEYLESIPTMSKAISDLETVIDNYPGSFGPIDQYTGKLGAMLGTGEGKAQTTARAISSNLLAGFGKAQMAGVLTDQDMKIIKEQIPRPDDTQTEAKQKLQFLKDFMKTKNEAWLKQKDRTNPGFTDSVKDAATVSGMKDNGDGTYTLPDGRVVRRKQ